MDWAYLVIAGLLEIGWPVGLKLSQWTEDRILWAAFAAASMAASGAFLWLAQKTIPMGTAYAVWTGIGAIGTALVGILIFKEPATFWRMFFIFTLITSIIGLKVVSH